MELKLVIPVPTSINALYINAYKYNPKTKKSEPTGARILSSQGMKSKKEIQLTTKKQMKNQSSWDYEFTKQNYIYIDLVFYFSRKGRDADNCLKLLQDSLQGIVFDNDSRVLCRTQKILYDSENPRVELHIHPVEYVGIFDNIDQYKTFESNCKQCKRYAKNCSILANALDGRIQDEISDKFVCEKFSEVKKPLQNK